MSSMSLPIQPRSMSFSFEEVKDKRFFANNILLSALITALSSTFPAGEAEFIESVRLFRKKVTDEDLSKQIRGFIGQEGHHSHQHKKINQHLTDIGLDAVRLENRLAKDIQRFVKLGGKRSHPHVRLGITVGLEHITAILAAYILEHEDSLEGLDEPIRELLMWHAIEEIEHKGVAFDVFKQCVDNEKLRIRCMKIATFLLVARVSVYILALLWWSKSFPRWREIAGFYRFLWGKKGIFRVTRSAYKAYFSASFHPWNHNNQGLIDQWKQRFAHVTD